MQAFFNRFNVLKKHGLIINHVLDIGAYRGEFTKLIKDIFPQAYVYMFESNEINFPVLSKLTNNLPNCRLHMETLSSESNKIVNFYSIEEKDGMIATGSSIYKERTQYYHNPIVTKKKTSTINDWYVFHKAFIDCPNWKEHGLIKLDTQGSELDILRGANLFIEQCQPKYFLIETSVQQYNEGSPLIGDIFDFMKGKAQMIDIFDLNYSSSGHLNQVDILFEKI